MAGSCREDDPRPPPTSCAEWDVRALVDHVIGGGARSTRLRAATTPARTRPFAARADEVIVPSGNG